MSPQIREYFVLPLEVLPLLIDIPLAHHVPETGRGETGEVREAPRKKRMARVHLTSARSSTNSPPARNILVVTVSSVRAADYRGRREPIRCDVRQNCPSWSTGGYSCHHVTLPCMFPVCTSTRAGDASHVPFAFYFFRGVSWDAWKWNLLCNALPVGLSGANASSEITDLHFVVHSSDCLKRRHSLVGTGGGGHGSPKVNHLPILDQTIG